MHICINKLTLIKSPRYIGGDFMFSYWFVWRRRWWGPQSLVHMITSEQLFRFLSFWQDQWTSPIDYLITFWSLFVVTLTLYFQHQIWNSLYLGKKCSNCHETLKQTLIELYASNLTIRIDLGCDLDLEFSRSNMEFTISWPKMVRLPQNKKQMHQLNSKSQM